MITLTLTITMSMTMMMESMTTVMMMVTKIRLGPISDYWPAALSGRFNKFQLSPILENTIFDKYRQFSFKYLKKKKRQFVVPI